VKSKLLKTLTLAITLSTIISCTDPVIVKPSPLLLPGRPILQLITDADNLWLKTNRPELHRKMVINDSRLKSHIKTLEAIIESTH